MSASVTLPPPSPSSSSPTVTPLTPAAAAPSPPIVFPLRWIMEHAAAPIKYRSITEAAKLPGPVTGLVASLPFTHRPALTLAMAQHLDGTWGHGMLTVPSTRAEHFEGVGTINAVRRLLEYGWDKDSPPLTHARRVLFRLLAEDDDPDFLFEFGGKDAADEDHVAPRARILREAAAAALAQAGYEGDPRLRGAARRIIERVAAYLRSPAGAKTLRAHREPARAAGRVRPAVNLLFTHARVHAAVPYRTPRRRGAVVAPPRRAAAPPGADPAVRRSVSSRSLTSSSATCCPTAMPPTPTLCSPSHGSSSWRALGFLRRNDNWCKLYERFLDDRDADGVWHPHKGLTAARSQNPFLWPMYPLEDHMSGDERWTDVSVQTRAHRPAHGRGIDVV